MVAQYLRWLATGDGKFKSFLDTCRVSVCLKLLMSSVASNNTALARLCHCHCGGAEQVPHSSLAPRLLLLPPQDNLSMTLVVSKAEDFEAAAGLTAAVMRRRCNDGDIVAQLTNLTDEAQKHMLDVGDLQKLELPVYSELAWWS
jgi:hypothetical protein